MATAKRPASAASRLKPAQAAALGKALRQIEKSGHAPRVVAKSPRVVPTGSHRDRFLFYDPFLSVISCEKPAFRDHDGMLLKFRDPGCRGDAKQLLYLALDAMRVLFRGPPKLTRVQWEQLLVNSRGWLDVVRDGLPPLKGLNWRDRINGEKIASPKLSSLDDFNLVWIVHQVMASPGGNASAGDAEFPPGKHYVESLWCMLCLREIDSALMALICPRDDAPSGVRPSIRAAQALANAKALIDKAQVPFKGEYDFAELGRKGAAARASQKAKAACRVLWEQCHPDNFPGGKSEWIKEMVRRFPAITDARTFAKYNLEWSRAAGRSPKH